MNVLETSVYIETVINEIISVQFAKPHIWTLIFARLPSFKLQPSTGSIKLYDVSVVNPLGRYKLKITREDMVEHSLTFDIIHKSSWLIFDGETCIRFGWISMNEVKYVNTLTKEHIFTEYKDVFEGLELPLSLYAVIMHYM